jgi:hypothetical protein
VRPLLSAIGSRAARITARQAVVGLGLLVAAVSLHKYWVGGINNYRIFAHSFDVLTARGDLYAPHPEHHWDVFKYSPTFALLMAPFAWLPEAAGLVCWNLLNALALLGALQVLWPDGPRARIAMAAIALELVVSIQSSQSNALVAAQMVLAFAALERRQVWRAGAFVAAGFFLKVYGAAVGVLSLLYGWRLRAIASTAVWLAVLGLAPLAVITAPELARHYARWADVGGTFDDRQNASVMRWLELAEFPPAASTIVQAAGALVFLLPFLRRSAWRSARFRLDLLCSLLMAAVIFNISAEPPTYVVAVTGGAIWYAARPVRRGSDHAMLAILLFTSFVSTDAYGLRGPFVGPYTLKTLGCLIVWLRINAGLLTDAYTCPDLASGDTVAAGGRT